MNKRFCPRCGGQNVHPSNDSLFRTGRALQQYFCDDCGYLGPLVVEKDGPLSPDMINDLKRLKRANQKPM